MVPSRVMEGQALYTFFTSAFLHAGLLHLLVNVFFLYIFGDNVEDTLGHALFVPFYFAAAIAASAAHMAMDLGSSTPSLGASGAVAGVMGAYLVFHPDARIRTFVVYRVFEIPAIFYLGLWFLLNVVNGILTSSATMPTEVAWFAHIGGFVFGVLTALMWKFLPVEKTESHPT
jgi:membrane associated rhomboid family serine protease